MICLNCNTEQGNNKYCSNCGNVLNSTSENIEVCPKCGKKKCSGSCCVYCGAKIANDSASKTELFKIRFFFSISLINMMIASFPAFLVVTDLVCLPILLLFGGGGVLKDILIYLPYAGISIVVFVTALVLYIKNRSSLKSDLVCPNCDKNLSNWGYCSNCGNKYDVNVIKANNKNNNSASAGVVFLYILSIINICIVCCTFVWFSIVVFPIQRDFVSIFLLALPILIYAAVSFAFLFAMADLRVKRK